MLSGWNSDKIIPISIPKQTEDLVDFPIQINLGESCGTNSYDAVAIFKELTPISTKDPYWNNVVLYMSMNGVNNSTSFIDYKGKLVTPYGDAKISTAQSKFGGSSAYFDGTGDYLTVPTSLDFDLAANNFTLEMWLYPLSTNTQVLMIKRQSVAARGWGLEIDTGGYIGFYAGDSNTGAWEVVLASSIPITVNTWNHISVIRLGTIFYVYINGALGGSVTSSVTIESSTLPLLIGGSDSGIYYFNGYLQDVRVTKGASRYTSNFTTPLRSFVSQYKDLDPYWSNVVLNMPLSTEIVDQKGKLVTVYGNTVISSNARLFNNNTCYFDGSGDYLSFASIPDWELGLGDFTIEFWVHPILWTPDAVLVSTLASGIKVGRNGTGNIGIAQNNVAWILTSSSLPAINSWHHIAGVRSGTTLRFYVNGINVGISTSSTNFIQNELDIGGNAGGQNFNGYISNLKITKGVARYTANFTPTPCARYAQEYSEDPYWDQTVLAMPMCGVNNGTTFTELKGKSVTVVGNTKTVTTQSKFGGSSAYFDGVGDCLSLPSSSDLQFGNSNFTIEGYFYFSGYAPNAAAHTLYSKADGGAATSEIWVFINSTASSMTAITLFVSNGSSSVYLSYNYTFTIGTFYHIAVVRDGNVFTCFVNGVSLGTQSNSYTFPATSTIVGIGAQRTTNHYFNGYIQDLRITKGIARYTANFTPPTRSFHSIYANPKRLAIEYNGSQCPVEIERWDAMNRSAQLWTKVPTVSGSVSTVLTLYYDSAHADNTTNVGDIGSTPAQGVWNSNYVAVYHGSQDPSTTVKDSTANARNLTPYGSMTTASLVGGPVGKAWSFDGVDDYMQSANSNLSALQTQGTLEFTGVMGQSVSGQTSLLVGGPNMGAWLLGKYVSANYLADSTWGDNIQSGVPLIPGFKHYGSLLNGGVIRSVGNGVIDSVTNTVTVASFASTDIRLNKTDIIQGGCSVRSIRISQVARSQAWLTASYQSDFDTLLILGDFILTLSGIYPNNYVKLYGITQQLQLTANVSIGSTFNISFYNSTNLLATYSGISNDTPLVTYLPTLSGTDYLWHADISIPGFPIIHTTPSYSFYVRYLCSGICMYQGQPASGVGVNLYKRQDGNLINSTTTAGTGTFLVESTYYEEHYVVALHPASGINAMVYDRLLPL